MNPYKTSIGISSQFMPYSLAAKEKLSAPMGLEVEHSLASTDSNQYH